ncbi:MAG TPA: hypothetical protein VHG28_21840 [Longimicrobiaceae bacterium]|nr:hypothetical protein [Longimicrobiaceae bacterium]
MNELSAMPSALSPLVCETFLDYCRACSESAGAIIPILRGAEPWPLGEWFPGTAEAAYPKGMCGDCGEDFVKEWSALLWRDRCARVLAARGARGTTPEPGSPTVLVRASPACIPAAVLAGSLGFRFRLSEGPVGEVADQVQRGADGPVVIAGLPEEFGDQLLFGRLAVLRDQLASRVPWSRLPVTTLLCGRDVAALSWLVAKLVAARGREPAERDRRFLHCSPNRAGSMAAVVDTRDETGSVLTARQFTPDEFVEQILQPHDLLAIPTHGFEACADGGAGTVLCGLRAGAASDPWERPGVLACGRGLPCPRGPRPVPLARFRSLALMVGSCNGLRLADSALDPDFNLGLSFVDGGGAAYVSSLFCNVGSDVCTDLFSAAMASGRTLGETVLLANTFLAAAGMEHPAFWTIGDPLFRLVRVPAATAPGMEGAAENVQTDFGDCHLAELLLRGEAARLAQAGRFAVAATADGQECPVRWFHRAEEQDGEALVRLYFFQFPRPLGRICWSVVDRPGVEARCRTALDGLEGWLEFFALAGQDTEAAELRGTIGEIRPLLLASLNRGAYDATALWRLLQQTDLLERLAATAQEQALGWLSTELMKSFWLTNLYMGRYRTEEIGRATCQNCGAAAIRRVLRNPLTEARRHSVVCPRCGIVLDTSPGGTVESLAITAPTLFPRERRVEAEVVLETRPSEPGGTPIVVCLRLSANSWCDKLPEPAFVEADAAEPARTPLRFSFSLPADLPPHRYFLKTVVATPHELAFASRVVYVV